MAKVLIEETILTQIANALRNKINSEERFYPNEMADIIDDLPLTITQTTYNVTQTGSVYVLSAQDYDSIDLSNYNEGDLFIVTPL